MTSLSKQLGISPSAQPKWEYCHARANRRGHIGVVKLFRHYEDMMAFFSEPPFPEQHYSPSIDMLRYWWPLSERRSNLGSANLAILRRLRLVEHKAGGWHVKRR